jgi:phytoene desaturase
MINSQTSKHILIIGAGVAGLVAAIRLLKQGFRVSIFEKNSQVGGRMNRLEEQGFKFDTGPTIVMMPEIYREIFEYSGVNPNDYIPMTLLDPLYQLHFADGTEFTVSSNLTKLIPTLEKFSPKDTEGYLRYLSDIYGRYRLARQSFLDRAFNRLSDVINPDIMLKTLQLRTFDTAYRSISKFVKNEKLRQALSFQTLYIGLSPFAGPSIYTVIPMIELLYGIWYIHGGLYTFAQAMQRRFKEMGGVLHLNSSVDEIVITNHKAKGLRIGQKLIEGDGVLVNADFPYAVDQLIKEDALRKPYPSKKISKLKYSSSAITVYLGMKKKYIMPIHQIRYGNNFKQNITELDQGKIPTDPAFYIYSPSQIDPTIAPANQELVYLLIPVPNLIHNGQTFNEKFVENYIDQVLTRIEKIAGFQDFKANIAFKKYQTPDTWKTQYNLMNGATFGLKPILTQSNYFRPQSKALPIEGLYFAGSSTHPGAGIPIVMLSAKIVADVIKKDFQS